MTVFDPSLYVKRPEVEPEPEVEVESGSELDGFELAELAEAAGTVFDRKLCEAVLAQNEALPYREYRKALGRFVVLLGQEEKDNILARRAEIEEAEEEWKELNYSVLRRLGFVDGEANMLKDKRLASPGMRRLILLRREQVEKALKAEAVLRETG